MHYLFYAIIKTRPDWSEAVAGLYVTREEAENRNRAAAAGDRRRQVAIRFRVKLLRLNVDGVAAIVQAWGREDAELGLKSDAARRLPEAWQPSYLAGWFMGARA